MQVPDGWQVVRLGNVAEVVTGNTPPRETSEYYGGDIPWVKPSDLASSRLVDSSEEYLTEAGAVVARQIPENCVLVSCIGTIGEVAISRVPLCFNQQINALIPSDTVWPPFLYWACNGQASRLLSMSAKTAVPILNKSAFSAVSISLPPLPEQRAIAAVLDSIDEAIERTEAVIAATERLRDALLHQLLTRGVPGWHTEWKDVPGIGTIPAGWEVVRLGEIYEVQLGKMLSPKARQGKNPRPYLTNRNVRWGKFDLSDLPTMDFDRREIEKFQLRPGDLLVCEGGDTGRAAVWLGEIADCYYQKALHRLRPIDENAISEFMLAVLMSYATKGILLEHSERTSISHLTRERLLRMRIPHSSRAEQDEIVAALGCVADSIRWAREEQDRIQTLKSSVAAALLMGRVRVDRLGR